ncbi:carboxylesterase/lipase family protein [Sphingomonas endolithica]|uniref:carboxylesterase/lipase family protein n=1 Tax=Sphingomonas endolithica TaxID=2972485 RepID=UPI0021AF3D2A|nr:carboxylesterase family protein [Sphingomonas sp. ZFBP2030]
MPPIVHALLAGASALLLTAAADVPVPAAAPVVKIASGSLRGQSRDGVTAFKGIPFAAPPVGPLRWRAPQPAARWAGVRDARAYGPDCMQLPFPSDAAPLGTAPAEDCLYANVWRPAGAARKLPVMVWIYGGGFVNGGASPPTYAGAALAKQGIMVVSFNYRIGRFGAFGHPQLTAADADRGQLANYGYMDQIAALRWVQGNIAAFGGDPANVTIIGESAGGMSVHALVTSPLTKGLFQRAVVQSGGNAASGGKTLATAEAAGVAFAQARGIQPDDPQALAKLRALTGAQVVDGLNLASMGQAGGSYSGPVADGRIAVDARAAYEADRFAHVPVMIGATSDDIGGADGYMITGARDVADLLVRKNVPVFYYRFDYVAGSVRTPATKGASHASDIPFFFDTAAIKYGAQTTAADLAAGRTASGYLVNFVKTGNANGAGLPTWADHASAGHPMLTLTAAGGASLAPAPAIATTK